MKESGRNPRVKKVVFADKDLDEKVSLKKETSVPENWEEEPQTEEPEEEEQAEEIEGEEVEAENEEAAAQKKEPEKAEKPAKPAKSRKMPAPKERAEEAEEETIKERELSVEEQELFGKFVHQRKSRRQLIHALDNMSLASCTGNIIITGEEEITTLSLAKAMIREMQYNDSNFSGKVAKVEGPVLNKKDVEATFAKLDNGALIIAEAAKLKQATAASVIKVLEKEKMGILVFMTGTKSEIDNLLKKNKALVNNFNLRVDIEPLDNESLVAYAKQYAEEQEYSIDEFGILALHTRIADRQTNDHEVSLAEVRELVDEAIGFANKKTPKHFMDILLAKRYDEEDMIILREKDFMHY